jgi:hypothetical protein
MAYNFGGYDPYDPSTLVNPFQQVDSRLTDPNGDSGLFNALRDDSSRAASGRTRSAMLGLKARGQNNPAGYAYAAMSAGTQGQSDLAGAMSSARTTSVMKNRDFSESLARNWIEQKQGLAGSKRSAFERASDLDNQYQMWVKQQKYMKDNKEKKKWYERINFGDVAKLGMSFLPGGQVATALASKKNG